MSVSTSFSKSKTNQIINFILSKYGKQDDYEAVIEHALNEEWIKTSNPKVKDAKAPREAKDKGQSKWTAYQKWAKKWADWNDIEIDRATMKEIYAAYDEDQLKEWERVAQELNAGKNIRDIENKPEIRMPKKDVDEAIETAEPAEPVPETEPLIEAEPPVETREELLAKLKALEVIKD